MKDLHDYLPLLPYDSSSFSPREEPHYASKSVRETTHLAGDT